MLGANFYMVIYKIYFYNCLKNFCQFKLHKLLIWYDLINCLPVTFFLAVLELILNENLHCKKIWNRISVFKNRCFSNKNCGFSCFFVVFLIFEILKSGILDRVHALQFSDKHQYRDKHKDYSAVDYQTQV